MSGVYLRGMEMPKRGHTVTLTILGGGEVCVQYYDCKSHLTVPIVYKAVPVPDHGRLLKVLKTERECVWRNCDRNCEKCDLSLEQSEILAAYDALISVFSAPADSPRCEPCQPTQPECGNCEWADKEVER